MNKNIYILNINKILKCTINATETFILYCIKDTTHFEGNSLADLDLTFL